MLRAIRMTSVGLLLTVVSVAVAVEPHAPNVQWQKDLKSAHKLAVAQNKPILLVFGAEWCTYCHKLERNVLNQPDTAKFINTNFVAVHLDADKETKVMELLEVQSLPCTVVLSPNADLLGKFNGYQDTSKYTQNLTQAQTAYRKLQTAAAAGSTVTR